MKIGFIGLGNIGFPMARNLVAAGHRVAVHDLDPGRAAELLEMGALWAESAAEAAAGCELLMTSLPGPREVGQVMEEAGPALPKGSVWCDLSTSDLQQTRALAARLAERGVDVLEAPVTGGVVNAGLGKITIYTAGDRAAYDRIRPALGDIAEHVFHFGDIGGGTVVKLITNFMAFIHAAALGEGLVFGRKYGLDHEELIEAIKASYADSFLIRTDAHKILSGDYATDFSIALACKDLQLTRSLATEMGLSMELTELTDTVFRRAMQSYGADAGSLSAIRQMEEEAGVSLAAKG